MTWLLDTNAVIAALAGKPGVLAHLSRVPPDAIVVAAPVLAELYFGAQNSTRAAENLARVDALARTFRVAPFDTEAASVFGRLKAALRRRGLARSDFNLAIAAIALVAGAALVTADGALADGSIEGLEVTNWEAGP